METGTLLKQGKNPCVFDLEIDQSLKDKDKDWRQKNIGNFGVDLSFIDIREKDRTKHVHRLHPYLGKFIPQLVEVFIDSHTDDFKINICKGTKIKLCAT